MSIERDIVRFQSKRKMLDFINKVLAWLILCLVFWGIIATNVWGAIIWAIIWLPVGYPITTWISSALMLPIFWLMGGRRVLLAQADLQKMLNGKMTLDEYRAKWRD
jgi:hypothetical protein